MITGWNRPDASWFDDAACEETAASDENRDRKDVRIHRSVHYQYPGMLNFENVLHTAQKFNERE